LTWLVVTAYLAVLALILRFVYLGASQTFSGSDFADPLASATVGRSIFHWLLFFMMMLVCFIVPGLTASAISGERERQTLVSLQVTLLRPRSIVLGKLLSSLAFTSFLVIASLPLLSVPFLVGGVSVFEVVKGVAMVLLTALVLATFAVACSALLRRTQAATVVAYGLTAALTIGTFIVYGGQRAMDGPINKASPAILALNPFVATADVVHGRNDDSSFGSPFTGLVDLVRPDITTFGSEVGGFADIDPRVGVIKGMPRPMPALGSETTVALPPPSVDLPGSEVSGPATTVAEVGSPAVAQPAVAPAPTVALLPDDPSIARSEPAIDGILLEGGDPDFRFQPFDEQVERPRADVLGMPMWVAWLVGSAILGGLALFVAVRRVSLPSARDSS
ncbi:MAG TPA: ABC transporter permease, partial [Acidimicrobiales bacterium]|nr:ABC transporter permease [Acidimicrobiales bacterium]